MTVKKKQPLKAEETYIARKRSPLAREIKMNHPKAYLLLEEIALHARRTQCAVTLKNGSVCELEIGEALVPSWQSMGKIFETRDQWRHAMKVLKEKYHQIDCRVIGLGKYKRSVAKLINNEIFDINSDIADSIKSIKTKAKKAEKKHQKKAGFAPDTTPEVSPYTAPHVTPDITPNNEIAEMLVNKEDASSEIEMPPIEHPKEHTTGHPIEHPAQPPYNNNYTNNKDSNNVLLEKEPKLRAAGSHCSLSPRSFSSSNAGNDSIQHNSDLVFGTNEYSVETLRDKNSTQHSKYETEINDKSPKTEHYDEELQRMIKQEIYG